MISNVRYGLHYQIIKISQQELRICLIRKLEFLNINLITQHALMWRTKKDFFFVYLAGKKLQHTRNFHWGIIATNIWNILATPPCKKNRKQTKQQRIVSADCRCLKKLPPTKTLFLWQRASVFSCKRHRGQKFYSCQTGQWPSRMCAHPTKAKQKQRPPLCSDQWMP